MAEKKVTHLIAREQIKNKDTGVFVGHSEIQVVGSGLVQIGVKEPSPHG